MKKQGSAIVIFSACWLSLWAVGYAQQRPLITEDVDLVKPGNVRFELGFSFLQDQNVTLFGIPQIDFVRARGDLVRLGEIGIHIGLTDYAEFQIQGPLRNYFTDRLNKYSRSDTGDFRFATKFKLTSETRRLPAIGFRVGAQLPNEKKLGTSTVSTFGSFLFGKHIGRVNGFLNLGVIITDRPTQLRRQSDKFLYGLGAIVPVTRRWDILGEVNGRSSNKSPGTENTAQARLGTRFHAAGLRWDVAGLAGLAKHDPKSGIVFGITYDAPLFKAPTQVAKP